MSKSSATPCTGKFFLSQSHNRLLPPRILRIDKYLGLEPKALTRRTPHRAFCTCICGYTAKEAAQAEDCPQTFDPLQLFDTPQAALEYYIICIQGELEQAQDRVKMLQDNLVLSTGLLLELS